MKEEKCEVEEEAAIRDDKEEEPRTPTTPGRAAVLPPGVERVRSDGRADGVVANIRGSRFWRSGDPSTMTLWVPASKLSLWRDEWTLVVLAEADESM